EGVAELRLEPVAEAGELVPLDGMTFVLLGKPALVLGGRGLRLGNGSLQALDFSGGVVALLPQPGELLLMRALRLGEGALEPVDVAQQPLLLGRGRRPRLGERGLELLDLAAQAVALLGGGTESGEPLEGVAQLLLEPVALGRELVSFAGLALLLLGQPVLVRGGRGLRLGDGGLEARLLLLVS